MTEATRTPPQSTATAPVDPTQLPRRMLREPSPLARRLAYAGLIPFVAAAVAVWATSGDMHRLATLALLAYSAVIVSFLGGIHWGFAFRQVQPDPMLFVWGVLPSLMAWVALLLPAPLGLLASALALIACLWRDRLAYPREGASGWLTLRLQLTAVAVVSCGLGAAGA